MKKFENPILEKISFGREIIVTSGNPLKFSHLGTEDVNYNSDKTVNVGRTGNIFG